MKKLIALVSNEKLNDHEIAVQVRILFTENRIYEEDQKTEGNRNQEDKTEQKESPDLKTSLYNFITTTPSKISHSFTATLRALKILSPSANQLAEQEKICIQALSITIKRNLLHTLDTILAVDKRLSLKVLGTAIQHDNMQAFELMLIYLCTDDKGPRSEEYLSAINDGRIAYEFITHYDHTGEASHNTIMNPQVLTLTEKYFSQEQFLALVNDLLSLLEDKEKTDLLKNILLQIITNHDLLILHIGRRYNLAIAKFILEHQPSSAARIQLVRHNNYQACTNANLYMLNTLLTQLEDKQEQTQVITKLFGTIENAAVEAILITINSTIHKHCYHYRAPIKKQEISMLNFFLLQLGNEDEIANFTHNHLRDKVHYFQTFSPDLLGLDFILHTLKTYPLRQSIIFNTSIKIFFNPTLYQKNTTLIDFLLCMLAYLEDIKSRTEFLQRLTAKTHFGDIHPLTKKLSEHIHNNLETLLQIAETAYQQMCSKQCWYTDAMPTCLAIGDAARQLHSFSLTSKYLIPQLHRDINYRIASFLVGDIPGLANSPRKILEQLQVSQQLTIRKEIKYSPVESDSKNITETKSVITDEIKDPSSSNVHALSIKKINRVDICFFQRLVCSSRPFTTNTSLSSAINMDQEQTPRTANISKNTLDLK